MYQYTYQSNRERWNKRIMNKFLMDTIKKNRKSKDLTHKHDGGLQELLQ